MEVNHVVNTNKCFTKMKFLNNVIYNLMFILHTKTSCWEMNTYLWKESVSIG